VIKLVLKPKITIEKFDIALFKRQMKDNPCIKSYSIKNNQLLALTNTLLVRDVPIGKFEIKINIIYHMDNDNLVRNFNYPLLRPLYMKYVENNLRKYFTDRRVNDGYLFTNGQISSKRYDDYRFLGFCFGTYYKRYDELSKLGDLHGCLMTLLEFLTLEKNREQRWNHVFEDLKNIIIPNLNPKEKIESFGGKKISEEDVYNQIIKEHRKTQKELRRILRC